MLFKNFLIACVMLTVLNINALTLSIPSYPSEVIIPDVFTCQGINISPQLIWSDAPSGTQSFAVVFNDDTNNFLHWKLYNIAADVSHMPEDNPNQVGTNGLTNFGSFSYGGPCPPSGTHNYNFTLYALNTMFNSEPSVSQIQAAAIESSSWLAFRTPTSNQQRYEYMATYRLTFHAEWSSTSHPIDFPGGAHFSPLVGNTHGLTGSTWKLGQLASAGIESMAESGSNTILQNEITEKTNTGLGENTINVAGINAVDTVEVEFDITASHPLFSMVSMLAPSPDWFIGVHDLDLLQNGLWRDNLSVDAFVYDSGTDNGTTFTSANSDTNPQEIIEQITTGSFANGTPIGRFEFELLSTQGIGPVDLVYLNGFE